MGKTLCYAIVRPTLRWWYWSKKLQLIKKCNLMIETSNNALQCQVNPIRCSCCVFTVLVFTQLLLCPTHIYSKMCPQAVTWVTGALSSNEFNQTNYAGFRFFSLLLFVKEKWVCEWMAVFASGRSCYCHKFLYKWMQSGHTKNYLLDNQK